MSKTIRNVFLIVFAVLLLMALAGCNEEKSDSGAPLQITTLKSMPSAYLNEPFDLREVLTIEKGVTYSATACYVEYTYQEATKDYAFREESLPVEDLCFTPTTLSETAVTITAKRGNQIAQKVIYIPTTIRAEPLDELYQSNGKLGYADGGIAKTINLDSAYIQGEDSATSLHVEFNGTDPHAYGNTFLELSAPQAHSYFTDKLWDNAIVTFWIYNPMEKDIQFQLTIVDNTHEVMRDWSNEPGSHQQYAKAGQWTQIFFSLRNLGTKHLLVKDELSTEYLAIKMQYADYSLTDAYTYDFYLDNLDVVPASMYPEIDTTYTMSDETLDQGWENMVMDEGWQGASAGYNYDDYTGEGSVCSLQATFPGEKGKTNSFICLNPEAVLDLKGQLDMTGGKISGYFKFENMPAKVSLDLINGNWEVSNAVEFALESVGGGWYYGELDMNEVRIGSGRSDNIVRIRLNFQGVTDNSVVYVDTLKYDYAYVDMKVEPVKDDWINLASDPGMTTLKSSKYVSSHLKATGSVRSLQIVADSAKTGVFAFNTELAVQNGTLSALPSMTKGTVHAYFYFGTQSPKASLQLANDQWKASKEAEFIFENLGNGWYRGSVPVSLLQGYEAGNGNKIIRIMLKIPAGYSVYVDGLMHYPNEEYKAKFDANDLFNSGIFTTSGFAAGSGCSKTTSITNGSSDGIYVWSEKKVGWPHFGVSFPTPVDFSAYSAISVDVKAINAWKWVEIKLFYLDSKGVEQVASASADFSQNGWQTISKNLSAFKGVNLSKITAVQLCVNMDDGFMSGGRNELWFDNLKLSKSSVATVDTFAAGSEKIISLDNDQHLATITFEYKITNKGVLTIAALNNDWSKYFGHYEFNADGNVWEDNGIVTEKLKDGYVRVTMDTSLMDRTNNNPNANNAPDVITMLYIAANRNTADGYIRNISYTVGQGGGHEPDVPVESQYTIGAGVEIDVEDGVYTQISFEYKITNDGSLYIAALSPDWIKYYGYYEFNAGGEVGEYNGVYCEDLGNGWFRVTLKIAELDRTNNNPDANNAPSTIGLLYTGNWNTATGTIRNVQVVKAEAKATRMGLASVLFRIAATAMWKATLEL